MKSNAVKFYFISDILDTRNSGLCEQFIFNKIDILFHICYRNKKKKEKNFLVIIHKLFLLKTVWHDYLSKGEERGYNLSFKWYSVYYKWNNFDFVTLCTSGYSLFIYDKMCVKFDKSTAGWKWPQKIFKKINIKTIF